ncbi:MAG: penicillin-binding transpeptidase domain-containing protein, partial [Gemmatimonadales bacterium]
IYDRNNRIVAENVPGYTVKLLATNADSLEAVLRRLATIVPLEEESIRDVVRRYQQARYQPAQVMGDAPLEVVARLEEHRILLPGLVIQAEPKRYYPAANAVAHVAGYVSEVSQADLEKERYPGAEPGTQVGKYGLELQYDSILRGTRGIRYVEVDARGRMVREEGATPPLPPVAGEPIHTTLDLGLQVFVDSIWPEGVRGAMVAMTPTGEILSLYSAPSFNPNDFIGGISSRKYRELVTDSARPLLNRAIQARYPPASPFKLAVAIMGLKRGAININSRMDIPCRGGMQMGNRYFRCWKKEGHGSLDLTGAIAQSCDVYFYQLGARLGLDAILEEGAELGFRDYTGIDLANEISPIYPAGREYFDEAYGPRGWTAQSTALNFSIGQGENTQTLIGMTRFYQGLANGGTETVPFLVEPTSDEVRDLGITPLQAEQLRNALMMVVEQGTAA